jgi:hypothetical protein
MKNGIIVGLDGVKTYYLNDKVHREDGPAMITPNGDKYWMMHDVQHRVDGPATELADGSKFWFVHGKRHRLDGPACQVIKMSIDAENMSIYNEWWINDKKFDSQKEFEQYKRLISFI